MNHNFQFSRSFFSGETPLPQAPVSGLQAQIRGVKFIFGISLGAGEKPCRFFLGTESLDEKQRVFEDMLGCPRKLVNG